MNFGNVYYKLDLVCLPLEHVDVIFGMNWLLSFSVNINCLTKSVTFSKPEERVEGNFLTVGQVEVFLSEEFVMFVSLKV